MYLTLACDLERTYDVCSKQDSSYFSTVDYEQKKCLITVLEKQNLVNQTHILRINTVYNYECTYICMYKYVGKIMYKRLWQAQRVFIPINQVLNKISRPSLRQTMICWNVLINKITFTVLWSLRLYIVNYKQKF